MKIKNVVNMEEEKLMELFHDLEQHLECVENEPTAVMTEDETFVIMTAEDFQYLQSELTKQKCDTHIVTFLEMLEGLSVEELEHILTLANSQLNIQMAREYFGRKEQL